MSASMPRNQAIKQELVRSVQFALVSLASAASNLLYIAALTHLTTVPFWLISLTSTEFSMLVNFALNDRFTFRNLGSARVWYARLGRFQLAAIGSNLLTAALATLLHSAAALTPILAQTAAIIVTFFVNFVTHRFWTFRGPAPLLGGQGALASAPANETVSIPAGLSGLSVIIPARNEQTTIGDLLARLDAAMTTAGISYEALVVDDYSSDGTADVANAIIAERDLPARVLPKRGKQGKSYALMQGFGEARFPALAMIDADLELPPESLPAMARMLSRCEMVVGRRLGYHDRNFLRGQLSAIFNTLVMRLFLGVNIEAQTGIKVFWKYVYESVELAPGRWSFDIEFIAKALAKGYRCGEIETPFQKRKAGVTNVNAFAVAAELLLSAVRIKLAILRTAKANAALRETAEAPEGAIPFPARQRAGFPELLQWAAPLALLALFLRVVMGPAFLSSTRYFGSAGDTNQYMWFIGWFWWAIEHGQNPMVTSAFNYPKPINIMDYTSVPALGLFFGWLYPIVGMIFTYNLIIVVNYVVILIFGALTLRALGVGRPLSGAGGLLFCLLPYITAQEWAHLNLAFVAPLFMVGYFLVKAMRSDQPPGWRSGALTGLGLAFAFYVSLETLLTLILCMSIVWICGFLCAPAATYRLTTRLARLPFVVGGIAPLLLTIPGLLNFLSGQGSQVIDVSIKSLFFSNDLLSLILPTPLFLIHNDFTTAITSRFTGNPAEWDGYLSAPLVALVTIMTIRYWNDMRIRLLAHATLALVILGLGPFLHVGGVITRVFLPWIFVMLAHAPLLNDAFPARLGLYGQYLAVMLVILGLDRYLHQAAAESPARARGLRLGVSLTALGLVALLWMPLTPFPTMTQPKSAQALSEGAAISRYTRGKPTLVLYEQPLDFNVVMGVLASLNDYDLSTTNVYGYGMDGTVSYKVADAFTHDSDGQRTNQALRHYLPQLGASKVMFVSVDDQPLDPVRLAEISSYLGAPMYDSQGLVVIWNAPATPSVP